MTFALIFVLVFMGLAGLLALSLYGLGTGIKWQANKPVKRFFSPIPRPGSFSFVTLEGRVVDIIENVVGWKLENIDNNRCFVLGDRTPGFLEKTLGVRWIGLFETIRVFKDWKWTEFQQVEKEEKGQKSLKYEIVPRKEDVTEFFFQFSHPVVIDDAEIQGNIRVNVVVLVTVLNLHPTRAFFLNKDPIGLFAAMVKSAGRSYVSNKTFDQVKEMAASTRRGQTNPEFWDILRKLNGLEMTEGGNPNYDSEDPIGIFGKLGEIIVRGEVIQVEAIGDTAEALEAARLADLRGQAKIVEAEKTAQALIVSAQGRMDAAERDGLAQRMLNEQNAGYYASLPGGARMFVAERVASEYSDITTWVEGKGEVDVTLPLPIAPPKPKQPARVNPTSTQT
ncbi:MAG: hypothetical protein AAB861_01280 [Patescibacteria group bacterium]